MWKLCFNVLLLRTMPDLETGGMIGLMSSIGLGQLLLPDVKIYLIYQSIKEND